MYIPHSRQDVGMCNPLNTPIISMSIAPPTTLATESVSASTDCKANLPKGKAVAHTAIVADAPKTAFIRFVISIYLSTQFHNQYYLNITIIRPYNSKKIHHNISNTLYLLI